MSLFKFFKVNHADILGKVVGNSLAKVHGISPIFKQSFVIINEDGFVFSIYNTPIWRDRFSYHQKLQLQISKDDLKYFTECPNPGKKQVSNIKYVVDLVDYGERYDVKTFDTLEEATEHCGLLNDSTSDYYEVRVEFDYEWSNHNE